MEHFMSVTIIGKTHPVLSFYSVSSANICDDIKGSFGILYSHIQEIIFIHNCKLLLRFADGINKKCFYLHQGLVDIDYKKIVIIAESVLEL